MPKLFHDRVRETTTTTGTVSIVCDGAPEGFQTFGVYAVGDTFPYIIEMGTQWERGKGTRTATGFSRSPTGGSNGAALVNFGAGTKNVFVDPDPDYLNGQNIGDLATAASLPDSYQLEVFDPDTGINLKTTVAALRAIFGGTAQADTVGPTMNGTATSSNVTQTGATIEWPAASDNVAVTGYEISKDGGTTYTNVGNVLSYAYSGLTADTTYPIRVRGYDAAGNRSSSPLVLSLTTAAASGGTGNAAPSMAGSLTTASVTSSGYTMNWPAGSDDVAVVAYETSIDGGTTWTDMGTALTRVVTGRPAATTDNLRVRARDGGSPALYSNILSATVTTSAAQAVAYNIYGYGSPANAVVATLDLSVSGNFSYDYPPAGKMAALSKLFTNGNGYLHIKAVDGGAMPASAVSGWSRSSTVPPDILYTGAAPSPDPNYNGSSSQNGATPLSKNGTTNFIHANRLWVAPGAGGLWYLWIKPVDGDWYCFNPSGINITGV